MSPAQLSSVLAGLPTVRSLTLGYCTSSFITILIVTPTSHLCPLLKTLEVSKSDITGEDLLVVVRSRTVSGVPPGPPTQGEERNNNLRRLRIFECDAVGLGTVHAIRAVHGVVVSGDFEGDNMETGSSGESGNSSD